jgi:hypothetical protein
MKAAMVVPRVWRGWFLLLACVLVTGCGSDADSPQPSPDDVKLEPPTASLPVAEDYVPAVYGGEKSLALMTTATRVEVYRVETPRGEAAEPAIAGFPIVAGPVTLEKKQRDALVRCLRDHENYEYELAEACQFDPEMAVRFATDESTLDVVICFKCEELKAYANGEPQHEADFTPGAAKLKAIAKQFFPKDPVILGLE